MQNLFKRINDLRPYWIGAIGGLLLGSAILGYRLHQQHQKYTENFEHALNLAQAQLQLLEAEFKPDAYLRGLYDDFGASTPGPINQHIGILVHEHAWIRQAVAEAIIEGLQNERAGIDDEKAAAGFYDRVIDVAHLMVKKNSDASASEPFQAMLADFKVMH